MEPWIIYVQIPWTNNHLSVTLRVTQAVQAVCFKSLMKWWNSVTLLQNGSASPMKNCAVGEGAIFVSPVTVYSLPSRFIKWPAIFFIKIAPSTKSKIHYWENEASIKNFKPKCSVVMCSPFQGQVQRPHVEEMAPGSLQVLFNTI